MVDPPAPSAAPLPPGPDTLPVVGSALPLLRDPFGYREAVVAEFGDVVDVSALGRRAYLVSHPDGVGRVLVDDADRFRKPTFERRFLDRAFGQALPLAEGEAWREMRDTLQPAFAADRIRRLQSTVLAVVDERIADWTTGAEAGDSVTDAEAGEAAIGAEAGDATSPGDATVSLGPELRRLSFDVLARSLLGVSSVPAETRAAFEDLAAKLSVPHAVLPDWLPTRTNWRYARALTHLREYVADVLADREGAGGEGSDVASLLVAAQEGPAPFSDDSVRDELLGLLFAGHEATASALTYALCLLDAHDSVRSAVLDEAESFFQTDGADPSALSTTRAVVDETLRLYPPNHLIPRETRSDVTVDGYRLPAGSSVYCSQWVVHRDERWWRDPDRFDPGRFDGTRDRPEWAYFPFGGGKRHCIGLRLARLELVLAVARLVTRVRVSPVEAGIPDPVAGLTLRPSGPVRAAVTPR